MREPRKEYIDQGGGTAVMVENVERFNGSKLGMVKTLERYQKCSYGAVEVSCKPAKELESSYREYLKLKTRFESLERTQRLLQYSARVIQNIL
ncbi:hypothetical protein G4B88_029327 [Cannabis sativa]|uniref:Uncharacterized protein n=1 Tax=Cannabis sativa TaxID=3483 RepID=A0A7J6FYY7_CANSA|nr:hypothetical protein G4B88_029327 [Cannabis sativa]